MARGRVASLRLTNLDGRGAGTDRCRPHPAVLGRDAAVYGLPSVIQYRTMWKQSLGLDMTTLNVARMYGY